MTNDLRWHGWARPEDVREMMQEMYQFLKENSSKEFNKIVEFINEEYQFEQNLNPWNESDAPL